MSWMPGLSRTTCAIAVVTECPSAASMVGEVESVVVGCRWLAERTWIRMQGPTFFFEWVHTECYARACVAKTRN